MPDPVILDWPLAVVPTGQVFYAPGQAFDGGYTSGGAETLSPEPGGRAYLDMAFNTLKSDQASRLASWIMSKGSAIWRVPLFRSVQLVPQADLLLPAPDPLVGVPWEDDAGDDLLWDGDIGWGPDYGVNPTVAALEGAVTLTIDMSPYGQVLLPGHVIGYRERSYMVDAIVYSEDDGTAVVTVTPPLRTAVVLGDDNQVTFRPFMYARMLDPSSFRAMFDQGRWVKPGNVAFAEVIL